jgi:hypothetical protein
MGHIGQRIEPRWIDLGIALLAAAVGSSIEAGQSVLNLCQYLFGILTQSQVFGLLKSLTGIIGHMIAVAQVHRTLGIHLGDHGL